MELHVIMHVVQLKNREFHLILQSHVIELH